MFLRKLILLFTVFLFSKNIFSQENNSRTVIAVEVIDVNKNIPVEHVYVINLTTLKGNITNEIGKTSLKLKIGDTLLLSKVGYQKEKIAIKKEVIETKNNKFYITSKNYDLSEVIIKPHSLTGILDVDLKVVETRSYPAIIKLKGMKTQNEILKLSRKQKDGGGFKMNLNLDVFDKKAKQMREITALEKQDNGLADIIKHRNDREIISEILGLKKQEIEEVLIDCGYPPEFIIKGSDLELLRAIQNCYNIKKQK